MQGMQYISKFGGSYPLYMRQSILCLAHPHRRLEQFPPLRHQTLDTPLLSHTLDLAGPNLLRVLLQLALTPTPNFSRPHRGMRTPVKTTRDSHSEQCVSRKKTPARQAVKHKARLSLCVLRNDTTYFVVLTSVQQGRGSCT